MQCLNIFSTKIFYACRWIDSTSCQRTSQTVKRWHSVSQPNGNQQRCTQRKLAWQEIPHNIAATRPRNHQRPPNIPNHPSTTICPLHRPKLWLPQCTLTFSLMPIFILHLVELKWQMWLVSRRLGPAFHRPWGPPLCILGLPLGCSYCADRCRLALKLRHFRFAVLLPNDSPTDWLNDCLNDSIFEFLGVSVCVRVWLSVCASVWSRWLCDSDGLCW